MIKLTNGKTITNQEAAALIRAEPWGLIANSLLDAEGHRCAGGVLLGSTPALVWPTSVQTESDGEWIQMVLENNAFKGTPAERREHMACWCENRPEK